MSNDGIARFPRRKALKSIGSGVVGIQAFSQIGTAQDETDVVIARGGLNDEPVSIERVPSQWNRHTEAINRVRERISQSLRSYDFVYGCRLVRSSQMIDNMVYSKIEIKVDPDATDAEIQSLPTSLDEAGVPFPSEVQVTDISIMRETLNLNLGGCTDNLYDDTPFPAGYYTKVEDGSTLSHSTAGYRVYDSNANEERILTANHVLTPGDCELGNGVKLLSYYNKEIGTGTSKRKLWSRLDLS